METETKGRKGNCDYAAAGVKKILSQKGATLYCTNTGTILLHYICDTDTIYSLQQEEHKMNAINYSELRATLKSTMDQVCQNHEPVIITRKNSSNLVLVSYEDYSAIEETSYLLRSPENAKRLRESITSFHEGTGVERKLIETEVIETSE